MNQVARHERPREKMSQRRRVMLQDPMAPAAIIGNDATHILPQHEQDYPTVRARGVVTLD